MNVTNKPIGLSTEEKQYVQALGISDDQFQEAVQFTKDGLKQEVSGNAELQGFRDEAEELLNGDGHSATPQHVVMALAMRVAIDEIMGELE